MPASGGNNKNNNNNITSFMLILKISFRFQVFHKFLVSNLFASKFDQKNFALKPFCFVFRFEQSPSTNINRDANNIRFALVGTVKKSEGPVFLSLVTYNAVTLYLSCRTEGMRDRKDAGHKGCGTGKMLDRLD